MCAYVKMIQLVVLGWYMTEPLHYLAVLRRRRTVLCIPFIALRLNLRLTISLYDAVATLLVVAMTSLQLYSYRTLTSEEHVRGSNAKLMVDFNIVLFLWALPCWC